MKRFVAALSLTALITASCGGSSAPPPTTFVPTEVAATLDYLPANDSFSFENFGGGQAPAELTVNLVRRLYGDTQVCAEVVDNRCTPHPVVLQLIQQANRSMAAGLCEGFAVLALRLAADPDELMALQADATRVAEMIKANPALLSELAYWYTTQFATEVQAQAKFYLEKSPIQIATTLSNDFANGGTGTGFTLGIYSDQGGHAVTPYKVESAGDAYRIYVYDSNWPGEERWIDVDEEGWVYALASTNPTEAASAWGGETGTMELTPMSARRGPFTCPFCPQEGQTKSGTLMTVAASGDSQLGLQIQDQDGNRLGFYDGEMVNEIPGATYRYLISSGSADPVLVFLPPTVETYTADVTSLTATEDTEEVKEAFSLLVLDEEKGVQIDAEVASTEVESDESLLEVAESGIEINEDTAEIELSLGEVLVEIELDEGEGFAAEFTESTKDEINIAVEIVDSETQVVIAEATIDTAEVEETAPVEFTIDYDEETGIQVEEDSVDAWVASDAEYFQAVAEDRVAEVLGEEFAAEREEFTAEWQEDSVLVEIDEDTWTSDYWEPENFDEDYYEEESAEWEEFTEWEEAEEFEEWSEDDPLAQGAAAPVLLSTEQIRRETILTETTEQIPTTLSNPTIRREIYEDEGGELTEIWTDMAWEVQTRTTVTTELLIQEGTESIYALNGETYSEIDWITEETQETISSSMEITDAWTTSELTATDQDCLYRPNSEPTLLQVRSDVSTLGSNGIVPSRQPMTSMKANGFTKTLRISSVPQSFSTAFFPMQGEEPP